MAVKEKGVQAEVKEAEPMEATQDLEARAQEQQVEERIIGHTEGEGVSLRARRGEEGAGVGSQ